MSNKLKAFPNREGFFYAIMDVFNRRDIVNAPQTQNQQPV